LNSYRKGTEESDPQPFPFHTTLAKMKWKQLFVALRPRTNLLTNHSTVESMTRSHDGLLHLTTASDATLAEEQIV
jgi:hypothetical protein